MPEYTFGRLACNFIFFFFVFALDCDKGHIFVLRMFFSIFTEIKNKFIAIKYLYKYEIMKMIYDIYIYVDRDMILVYIYN